MQFPAKTNAPAKGDVIGPVELVERIGVGGFGSVWRVCHLRTRETLALKVLHPSLYEEVPGAGPSVVDRFLREARILQNLRHPGVIRILDVIEEPQKGLIAYLMELLEGRDLSTYALKTDLPSVLEIFARTARTLVAVHEKGLLHRDIKLTNIFVCNQLGGDGFPVVKLIDFGIAKDLETSSLAHRTAAGHYVGTLESMAPECYERLLGTAVTLTPAVDQWSLGVSLYHAVSGRVPFKATNEAQSALIQLQLRICNDKPPPLGLLRHYGLAAVPDGLEAIVRRCLEKKPEDRYPTLGALADDLSSVFAEQTDENTAVSSWEPTSPTLVPSQKTVDGATDDIPAYDDRTSRTAQGALSESEEYAETAIDDPHALQTAVGTLRDVPDRPSTTAPLTKTKLIDTPGPPLVRPVSESSLAAPQKRTWGLSLGWTMLLIVAAAALSFLVGLYG
ncbi:MAG: serine/threonine-protein kinase [Deltaproteobacteria bacterium]